MKHLKYVWLVMLSLIGAFVVCGCQEKVTTVAQIQDEEGQIEYIKMQEFEFKEKAEESGREKLAHCVVLVPTGYHESEEIPGMYVHERAPMESSNIYYTVTKGEGEMVSDELTEEIYKESVEEAFAQNGKEISMEVTSFEKMEMDGVPTYKVRSAYTMDKHTVLQLTYMILAEDTHTITYSQSKDDELMADFDISEGQIKLVKSEEIQMADAK